ncbi:MAG: hypothetical protein FD189_1371 [Elusimicrobia bacterium]|nr:MAG: hypothetical protein FD154_1145 [Elusimicrobiota bacterium]KAF0155571.1 MAG: hypothetical protein FD189_1371 [Elusimicrobiota bacterium]
MSENTTIKKVEFVSPGRLYGMLKPELDAAPMRLALPDCPAPASVPLEKVYYKHAADIVKAARKLVGGG